MAEREREQEREQERELEQEREQELELEQELEQEREQELELELEQELEQEREQERERFSMKHLLLFAGLLAATPAAASDLHLLELDEFGLDAAKIVNHNDQYFGYQDPQNATGEYWQDYTAARFNLNLVEFHHWGIYWNNEVAGYSTDKQFREVRWSYEGGVNFHDYVHLFWRHMSDHVLDSARPGEHFELDNMYGLSWTVYKRDR